MIKRRRQSPLVLNINTDLAVCLCVQATAVPSTCFQTRHSAGAVGFKFVTAAHTVRSKYRIVICNFGNIANHRTETIQHSQ